MTTDSILAKVADETSLATEQLQNATDAINTLVNQINSASATMQQQVTGSINALKAMLPRFVVSQNQELVITAPATIPDNFYIGSKVTCGLYRTINLDPSVRDSDQLSELTAMGLDLGIDIRKEHFYAASFNIIRLTWTGATPGTDWIGNITSDQGDAVRLGSLMTLGALVKLESGDVSGYWLSGAETGKWTFTNQELSPTSGFGAFSVLAPKLESTDGSLLLALPAVISGAEFSASDWFANILIQK